LSHWETTSRLEAGLDPALVWRRAYLDPGAWTRWNAEIKRASLARPLGLGAAARIVFHSGLRPAAPIWRRILGPAAARSLPEPNVRSSS
jgi:hypothetical protein